jgi:hypothetical protein
MGFQKFKKKHAKISNELPRVNEKRASARKKTFKILKVSQIIIMIPIHLNDD